MKKATKKFLALFAILALFVSSVVSVPAFAETKSASAAPGKNIVAYFPNWGTYNAAHKNISVDMIPWDKVTVVNHAFFEVDSNFRLASTDTFADFDKSFPHSEGWDAGQLRGHFGEYKYYKSLYPQVKVLVSIGGWTRGQNFHAMAATAAGRATFVSSLIEFLNQYPFIDGFDIDWEYPGINRAADPNDQYDRGCPGGPEDKENFTLLLKEIREAYNSTGHSDKLLTIAGTGGYDKLACVEPDKFYQYLDWINVMTYDFHGAWETTTGHQAGLYANPQDTASSSPVDIKGKYNTDAAMRSYTELGVPADKLNVGTPYYSRGWKGVTGGTNGMYGTATGAAVGTWDNPSSPGGQYPYFTLKTMENSNGYQKFRDDTYAKTPWLYNASAGILLSYEDPTSLSARCDYINSNGYGGLIIWEISGDTDDFEMTTLAHDKLIGGQAVEQVAAPTFMPAGGTYSESQQVTISCATSGASIYYTTDGTTPTVSSMPYTGAIAVSSSKTIKAIAVKSGMTDSAVAGAAYTIGAVAEKAATPTFSVPSGTYTDTQSVEISCATSGASIYYTTDGTVPTASSTLYTGAITVSSSKTIKAIAVKSGMTDSDVAGAAYTIDGGNSGEVSPWAPNTGYRVGDIVSYNGKYYQCIQAHTSLVGWEPSNVPALWQEYTGTVTTPAKQVAAPVFAPAGGTYSGPQQVTMTCATEGAVTRYTTDGTEPTESSAVYSAPVAVSANATLKAKAFRDGMTASAVSSAAYTIQAVGGGDSGTVSPWAPNTGYQAGDIVSYNGKYYQCIQAHTSLVGWEPSNVPALWQEYTGTVTPPAEQVATPTFTPAGGSCSGPQQVTITCATEGAVIRYTTDGAEPAESSSAYSGPVTVSTTTTVKAKAFHDGMTASGTATATYIFQQGPVAELPEHLLTGYWQNFDNGATCLKISDVPTAYRLIAVAFADTASQPGAVSFTLDPTLSARLGGYTKQQFIADIAAAKGRGQKVILSVGGQNGSVSVGSDEAAANFASSVYSLMQEYGFDGVDIDLENGISPDYMASALRQLSAKAGSGLIVTLAPQTLDMQTVSSGYFRLALQIKDILTIVNTQYYNSGSMLGQDGKVYSQGTVDFITALAAIQLENGLRPDQVGLGLPASSSAAGSGYVNPSVVNSALNILAKGASGGSYTPPRTYPSLRGAMTWSINWDASNQYNFANTVAPALAALPG